MSKSRILSKRDFETRLNGRQVDFIERSLGMPLRGLSKESETRIGHVLLAEDWTGAATLRMKRRGDDRFAFEVSSFQASDLDASLLEDWNERIERTIAGLDRVDDAIDAEVVDEDQADSLLPAAVDIKRALSHVEHIVNTSLVRLADQPPSNTQPDAWFLLPLSNSLVAVEVKSRWSETNAWVGDSLSRLGMTARIAQPRLLFIIDNVVVASAASALEAASPDRFASVRWDAPDRFAQLGEVLTRFLLPSTIEAAYQIAMLGMLREVERRASRASSHIGYSAFLRRTYSGEPAADALIDALANPYQPTPTAFWTALDSLSPAGTQSRRDVPSLTPREFETITLAFTGRADHDIAESMGVKLSTVQRTRRRAFEKLMRALGARGGILAAKK